MRGHNAPISWSEHRVRAGLPHGMQVIQPAWVMPDGPGDEGWSLVCEFSRAPVDQGNPSEAHIRFLMPNAPHDVLLPGVQLRLFDGFSEATALVEVLEGGVEQNPESFTPLESALLDRIAASSGLAPLALADSPIRRDLTGAGSFAYFEAPVRSESIAPIPLRGVVTVPGVSHGLGAVLFLGDGVPHCLEIYTFGEEAWDGQTDGFSIDAPASGPAS